jgi:nucleoside-diphosphate-sugar epimerase
VSTGDLAGAGASTRPYGRAMHTDANAMRIFLAGATGVLGSRMIPMLQERGHTVIAMTRRPALVVALRALGAEPIVADAYDAEAVVAAVSSARPDAIIDQLTDLSAADSAANARLRIHGTRNLVDAARAAGVARIVAQSVAWCYEPGTVPADETVTLDLGADEPRRTTVVGVAALERTVRELPEWVVLRYGQLYGSGTWFAPDGAGADDARAGRLRADGDVSSFVHVDDAASAAVEALEWPTGPVNVCDDEPAAARDWVPVFCAAVGAAAPVPTCGRSPAARGADSARARRLGWAPRHRSWREGFSRMAAGVGA